VASGVLTGTHPDEAPRRLAAVVHCVAGLLTGPPFVWLLLVAEGLLVAKGLLGGGVPARGRSGRPRRVDAAVSGGNG